MGGCERCAFRGWVVDADTNTATRCICVKFGPVYAGGAPSQRGSETSRASAEAIDTSELGRLQRRVYSEIARSGYRGMTDEEIEIALSLTHQCASARRRELHLKGLIGSEDVRINPRSGRPAQVWKVAAHVSPEATRATVETSTCPNCGHVY